MHSLGLIKLRRPFDLDGKTLREVVLSTSQCEGPDPLWETYPHCTLVDWIRSEDLDTRPLRQRFVPLVTDTIIFV